MEFLHQAGAALVPLASIADLEGEAGHGTERRSRIALVQMIEQRGANIVDSMNVDPGLRVRQAIDASPRRGVLPDGCGCKGITAVTCERHLGPQIPNLRQGDFCCASACTAGRRGAFRLPARVASASALA